MRRTLRLAVLQIDMLALYKRRPCTQDTGRCDVGRLGCTCFQHGDIIHLGIIIIQRLILRPRDRDLWGTGTRAGFLFEVTGWWVGGEGRPLPSTPHFLGSVLFFAFVSFACFFTLNGFGDDLWLVIIELPTFKCQNVILFSF